MESINNIKKRFGIIGNDYYLNKALKKTIKVSYTDISVLIFGESGVGKEFFPKIIHQLSYRKHHCYIAVNCGAIPEGTIESELFGHEKGSFTGATYMRKGYFEMANKGTVFLDEVGELPLSIQIRLLRVLETGEFMKVGSSIVQKTNVRIVAATNINLQEAIKKGKFREDLYYRLNTVQIEIPPLRKRKDDIKMLFNKFANDFSERYEITPIIINEESFRYIKNYYWPGNIRQLKNFVEQISILEKKREISIEKLKEYLPESIFSITTLVNKKKKLKNFSTERDILYKIIFDMKKDLNDLKRLIIRIMKNQNDINKFIENNSQLFKIFFENVINYSDKSSKINSFLKKKKTLTAFTVHNLEYNKKLENNTESLSLQKKELDFIRKILTKNNGKRKMAAKELGISERTLYRKIKEHGL
jgi:transcriptional regulator with PAS, ATPase and Fis domain